MSAHNMKNNFLPSSTITDNELLQRLQQSDEQAFTFIYERYHRLLYVVAYKYMKDADMAKDTVQHIFLKLWETRSLLTIRINLRNYLYTMMKNHLLNEIRNNYTALEKSYELSQESMPYNDELLARLEEKEMMQQLYQAINQLPEQKRLVCLYKLKDNLSNLEIANKMCLSVPTIKTHYSQAIKILRIHFDKCLFILIVTLFH